MQLDIEVSPPANTLTVHVVEGELSSNCVRSNFVELFSSHLSWCPVTDRQIVMHKSPSCISTGVLKKCLCYRNMDHFIYTMISLPRPSLGAGFLIAHGDFRLANNKCQVDVISTINQSAFLCTHRNRNTASPLLLSIPDIHDLKITS